MNVDKKKVIHLSSVLVEGNSKQRIFREFAKQNGISGPAVNFLIACWQLREIVGYIHKEDLLKVLTFYNRDSFVIRVNALRKRGWLCDGVGNTLELTSLGEMVIDLFVQFFIGEVSHRLSVVSSLARSPRRAGRVSSLLSSLPTAGKGPID